MGTMFINSFIIGLMRFVGGVMFFSGMAFLLYAVIGGYYGYSPLLHAVCWGFAGWILFFVGKDLLEQYKPAQAVAASPPQAPMPPPQSPYPNAGNASYGDVMRHFGGRQQRQKLAGA